MKNHSGVIVREDRPSRSLQKYPPIRCSVLLWKGKKEPRQSCFLLPLFQLCPQAVVLSSTQGLRHGQGHSSGFLDLFAGDAADTPSRIPRE